VHKSINDDQGGLYYFNARWYDAELGRFTTEDPIKDGTNWYAYVNNRPLNHTDPSGLRPADMVSDLGTKTDSQCLAERLDGIQSDIDSLKSQVNRHEPEAAASLRALEEVASEVRMEYVDALQNEEVEYDRMPHGIGGLLYDTGYTLSAIGTVLTYSTVASAYFAPVAYPYLASATTITDSLSLVTYASAYWGYGYGDGSELVLSLVSFGFDLATMPKEFNVDYNAKAARWVSANSRGFVKSAYAKFMITMYGALSASVISGTQGLIEK